MNEIENQIFKLEIIVVADILMASPYLDSNIRKRISEFSTVRFPNFHKIVEKVADQHLSIPKGEEFPYMSSLVNDFYQNHWFKDILFDWLIRGYSNVNFALNAYQAPYNLINLQKVIIGEINEYLSELYQLTNQFLLDEIRVNYPEVSDQAKEIMRLTKVFSIEESDDPTNFGELIAYTRNKYEQGFPIVVSTGFSGIDKKINEGGLAPKRLTVLEAKTGIGKTSIISQILCKTALTNDQGALFLSFEMDPESLMLRMLSQVTQNPAQVVAQMLSSVDGPSADMKEIIEKLDKQVVIKYPDNSGDTEYIESQIINFTNRFGRNPAIVVVDYIQQLSMDRTSRFTSLSDELTTISRTIRGLAQRYNTHIIVTSQVMETADGSARAFGASGIEFSADHVIVLSKSPTAENKRILKFKKNRFGPSGDEIELMWNAKTTSFFELNSDSFENMNSGFTSPYLINNENTDEWNPSGDRIVF